MKVYVSYYDIESDSIVDKDCYDVVYNGDDPSVFSFTPVDAPVKIYKSIIINHPIVEIYHDTDGGTKIQITGYQTLKGGHVGKTKTLISFVHEG